MKKNIFCIIIFLNLCVYSQNNGSLVVVNKADNTISILDLNKNKEVAVITTGYGPHEVAISLNGKFAAVTNYGKKNPGNSLTIIDLVNKTKLKDISLKNFERPHGIEFLNNEELIVTCEKQSALIKANINTNQVSLVAQTKQKVGHMVALAPKNKYAYVANIVSGTVSKIDIKRNKLIDNLILKKGIEGIAVTPSGKEIWVANREDSTVTVLHSKTYKELAKLPAHQVAFRVKILPNGKYAMVSNGKSGNVSVYNVKTKKWIKDINLYNVHNVLSSEEKSKPPIPVGLAMSLNNNYAFVACANYNVVAIIDTITWEVTNTIPTGNIPDGLYYSSFNYN